MADLKCDRCGGTKFFEGPSGGASINIICANPKCRARYNHTPILDRLDFIGFEPSEEDRKREADEAEAHRNSRRLYYYMKGVKIYLKGGLAIELVQEPIDYHVDGGKNVLCLLTELSDYMFAGFLDAMKYQMVTRYEDEEVEKRLSEAFQRRRQSSRSQTGTGQEASQQSDGAA